jgi:hypothetical protein
MTTRAIENKTINTITNDCTEFIFAYDLENGLNISIRVSTNIRQQKESKVIVPVLYNIPAANSIKPSQVKGMMNNINKNRKPAIIKYRMYFAVRFFLKPGVIIK